MKFLLRLFGRFFVCRPLWESQLALLVFLVALPATHADSPETRIAVPGARRAIEVYSETITAAEASYIDAGERASDSLNGEAILRQALTTYEAAIDKATRCRPLPEQKAQFPNRLHES